MKVNDTEYKEIALLGKGKGGYSYLVKREEKYYVLKQIHHEPCDYYQFGDKLSSELNDYKRLKEVGIRLPELLEVDEKQERILKEYIEGKTIEELVKEKKMKQTYYDQIEEMCHILYKRNLNIDYYPTNFIVQNDLIWYIDYECNEYMEEWDYEHWGAQYWK